MDVLDSSSRVRDQLIDMEQRQAADLLLKVEAAYREKEDLILVGAYQKGSDPIVDAAMDHREDILRLLRQSPEEHATMDGTRRNLIDLANRLRSNITSKKS
jgi:flagellar biosynthesis/type III secretory pathway ATPase